MMYVVTHHPTGSSDPLLVIHEFVEAASAVEASAKWQATAGYIGGLTVRVETLEQFERYAIAEPDPRYLHDILHHRLLMPVLNIEVH